MKFIFKFVLVFLFLMPPSVNANEGFIGEVRMFAGNFAPRNWAFCQGQLLAIRGNEALFSILGTTYGGDGRTNFALPDLRGRFPTHPGTGPGLTFKRLGERGGTETVTLTTNNLPAHSHTLKATSETAITVNAENTMLASTPQNPTQVKTYNTTNTSQVNMHADSIGSTGGNQAVNNMPPFLGINFIICLNGIFPSRS